MSLQWNVPTSVSPAVTGGGGEGRARDSLDWVFTVSVQEGGSVTVSFTCLRIMVPKENGKQL